jgi:hypothetical protein
LTSFDIVETRALAVIEDYKLKKLFDSSIDGFEKYCDGLLMVAIPQFYECLKSLRYDEAARTFSEDLDEQEVSILANFFVITWWQRENNNAAQIALKLKSNNSFSFNSEAQNFKEKQNVIDKLREENARQINAYLAANLDSIDL